MIADKDRSGWFGASDTNFIVGNWETKTFAKWWIVKQGVAINNFESLEMKAGTEFEHSILGKLGVEMEFDRQILMPDILLRVNLDGNNDTTIFECKTYKLTNGFKLPKNYIRQVNIQMYATNLSGKIIAYGLTERDYKNFLLEIDTARISIFDVERDENFIKNEWLPKIKYLADCLKGGKFPRQEEFLKTREVSNQ